MKQKTNGFTLVELLVVIAIIAVITGISLPALSDVMSKRQLVGVAQSIQMACMSTRARAIAQREEQYLVFYYNTDRDKDEKSGLKNETTEITGKSYTIVSYDSNKNDSTPVILQVGNPIEIPDVINYEKVKKDIKTFYLTFYSDGTLSFSDPELNQPNSPEGTEQKNYETDLVFSQTDFMMQCYIDINQNTGKVRSKIKEPRNNN